MSVCYNQPFIQAQMLLYAPSALIYKNSALCTYNVLRLFPISSKQLVAVTVSCYGVLLQTIR
jgi:hypothetical protein